MTNVKPKPVVYQYWDYRLFISDMIDYLRANGKYSVRKFAKEAGFGSSGYLNMILKRQRNLSLKTAKKLCSGFGLNDEESFFLQRLIAFNQEMDFETKDKLYKELQRSRQFEKLRRLDTLQYEFLSKWYFMALFEALAKPLASNEIDNWATALEISTDEVREALKLLEKLDFAEKKDGCWVRKEIMLQTDPSIATLANRNFHRQMIEQAVKSLDQIDPKDREMGALTISLSREKFEEIRKMIFKFQQDLNMTYSEDANPESIYQFNIQLFPLARYPK